MDEKRKCKIVQDLLPSFVDNLTNKETTEWVKEHLKECEKCKTTYENMKNVEEQESKIEEKEIDFMKKINKKIKLLISTIVLIVLCLLIIIGAINIKKTLIISELSSKAENYVNDDNYHITVYTYGDDGFYKEDIYVMGKKIKIDSESIENYDYTKVRRQISYGILDGYDESGNEKYKTTDYIVNDKNKIVISDGITYGKRKIINQFKTNNIMELLKCATRTSITLTDFRGEKCYKLDNLKINDVNYQTVYVGYETGLIKYENNADSYIQEYKYEINTVTEQDFDEPDKSEYKSMTLHEYAEDPLK